MLLSTLQDWIDPLANQIFNDLSDEYIYTHLPTIPSTTFDEFKGRIFTGHHVTVFRPVLDQQDELLPVGLIRLDTNLDGVCEIGFIMTPQHQGNGYASLALKYLIEAHERSHPGISFLACIDSRNVQSIRVLESNGLCKIGQKETILRFQPSMDLIFRRCD